MMPRKIKEYTVRITTKDLVNFCRDNFTPIIQSDNKNLLLAQNHLSDIFHPKIGGSSCLSADFDQECITLRKIQKTSC